MLANCGRRRCLTPGWTELWMNPCVDLPSCLLSAFEFLHIPWPGEGPFAVDKPGHHDVFVSRVRALISCPHSSAVVGCQGVKVTPKPGRPQGLCCLKTETSCVAWWSCCQCSCPTAGHQHIWGFQWAHESSGRRDVIHLHNPALGCALLAAFPTELSYLDPLMKHLLIPYNQELLFGRSLCSLAVLALCLFWNTLTMVLDFSGRNFPYFSPHSTGVSASTRFLTALRMPSTGNLPALKYPGTVWAAVLSDPFKSWEWLFWCLISANMKGSFPSNCALGRAMPFSPNQKRNQRSHFL